jgi:hypothetical protein
MQVEKARHVFLFPFPCEKRWSPDCYSATVGNQHNSSLHTVAGIVLGWYCQNFRHSQKAVITHSEHCWPFRFKQITVSLLPRKVALRRREGNRHNSTIIAPVRRIGYLLSYTTVWVKWLYFHWVSHYLASSTAFLETSPLRLTSCDNVINAN